MAVEGVAPCLDLPHGLAGCQVRLAGQQVVDGGGQGVGVVEVVLIELEVRWVSQLAGGAD